MNVSLRKGPGWLLIGVAGAWAVLPRRSLPAVTGPGAPAAIAVYRTSTREWFLRRSTGASRVWEWGAPALGDVPVPADYDGDGIADIAVYRASTGEWFISRSSDGGLTQAAWGAPALDDTPVPADYDGDGRADLAVYRRSTGEWFVARSSDGTVARVSWGGPLLGDIPIPAPY